MKNIKHLASYKGNDIMELMDRINSLEPTRPNEWVCVYFEVCVNCDGRWFYDCSLSSHSHLIHSISPLKYKYDKTYFSEEVVKYLAHLDMDFDYEWEGVDITYQRRGNLYDIGVRLHRKTA